MAKQLVIDPAVGDAICSALEQLTGVEVDIILMATAIEDKWARPCFITSIHPDEMEQVMEQIGAQIREKRANRRITGQHESEH